MKRYALIGASGRATYMYAQHIVSDFANEIKIVGLFDPNPLRCEALKKITNLDCPTYTDCDRMLAELKPDRAIVTTVDRTHHEYIIKALQAGADVITEKPMTIDEKRCLAILEAEKKTGRQVVVTFNYRYAPYATAIKQALRNGAVGEVLSVDFEWILDTRHGADYFRRWHRQKANSGGLLVHKATHHFDLINWWIEGRAGLGVGLRHPAVLRSDAQGARRALAAHASSPTPRVLLRHRGRAPEQAVVPGLRIGRRLLPGPAACSRTRSTSRIR